MSIVITQQHVSLLGQIPLGTGGLPLYTPDNVPPIYQSYSYSGWVWPSGSDGLSLLFPVGVGLDLTGYNLRGIALGALVSWPVGPPPTVTVEFIWDGTVLVSGSVTASTWSGDSDFPTATLFTVDANQAVIDAMVDEYAYEIANNDLFFSDPAAYYEGNRTWLRVTIDGIPGGDCSLGVLVQYAIMVLYGAGSMALAESGIVESTFLPRTPVGPTDVAASLG